MNATELSNYNQWYERNKAKIYDLNSNLNLDSLFNASGKYPERGIEFCRNLKLMAYEKIIRHIPGGKDYNVTTKQSRDAKLLYEAILNNDFYTITDIYKEYPQKSKKMVTGHTPYNKSDRNYGYHEISSKAMVVYSKIVWKEVNKDE